MLKTRELFAGLYALEDERVRQFLVIGGHRDLDAYIASLEKLEQLIPADVTVLPCHSACPIDAGCIARDLADARALRDGALASDPHPALPCRVYHGEATDFLF